MATSTVVLPDGREVEIEHPEGASREQIFGFAKKMLDDGKISTDRDPTLGQIGKGLAAEVAIAEGAKYAGAAAGSAIGATIGTAIPIPVVGTVTGTALGAGVGYVVGAISGGVTGSIAAQEIENPDGDISWGRVVGDTFLNFIPGSKFAKGGKFLTTSKRAALANITTNAAIGGVSVPAAQLIEGSIEGRLPTQEELLKGGATGLLLGGALGASGEVLAKSYAKFAGKKTEVLTDAYNKGDKDAKNVVDPLLKAADQEKTVSQVATNTLAKENDLQDFPKSAKGLSGVLKRIKARVAPSLVIGRELDLKLENIRRESEGLQSLSDKIMSKIQNRVKTNPALNDNIAKFLVKEADLDSELSDVLPDLEKFRDEMLPIQEEISQLLDEGFYKSLTKKQRKKLSDKIRASIQEGTYKKTEYRIFTDKNFIPSETQRVKAQEEIADRIIEDNLKKIAKAKEEGLDIPVEISRKKALKKADKHLSSLQKRSARQAETDRRAGKSKESSYIPNSIQGSLKIKRNPGIEESKYLGVIEDAGEQVSGTLTGTARLRQAAKEDKAIMDIVESSGIGVRVKRGAEPPEGLSTIPFKTVQDVDIFVPDDFLLALNKARPMGNQQKGNFSKYYDPFAGAVKLSKIFLSPILYSTQLVSGMGLTAATGILSPGRYIKHVGRGIQIVAGDMKSLSKIPGVQKILGDKRKFLDDYQDAVSLGIVGKDVVASDIRRSFEGTYPWLDKVISKFGKAYSAFDTTYRYALWKSNQDTITKMFPGIDEKTAKLLAANFTNDTYPNYDKVAGAAKFAAQKALINPYSSFSFEMFRNTYHLAKYADQMAKGEFGKNLGVDPSRIPPADEAFMRREGVKRLAAVTAVVGLAPAATEQIVRVVKGKNDTVIESDEERKAVEETIAHPWDRGKTLVSVRKPDGKILTVDPSYIMPHAIMYDGFKAGLSGDPNAMSKYVINLFGSDGGMVVGPVLKVLNNQNTFSDAIEFQEDLGAEERMAYLFKEMLRPPGVNEAKKWNDAITNQEGNYDMGDLTRRAFGIRLTALDPKQQAKFAIKESVENLNGTKSRFYNKDAKNLEGADLQAAYEKANAQAKQSYDKIARHYKNLGTLGFGEKEIYNIMKKEANVSAMDLLRISSGLDYKPFDPVRVKSTSDLYEELDPEISKEAAIKLIEDPDEKRKLENYHKEQEFIDKKNISISERNLMGLVNVEKVKWLQDTNASRAAIRDLRKRKIISNTVANQALRTATR